MTRVERRGELFNEAKLFEYHKDTTTLPPSLLGLSQRAIDVILNIFE